MDLKPKKILIIKPSSLGDVIQSLPVAAALKKYWPGVRIEWLINNNYRALLELCPDIDKTISFHRHRWGRITNFGRTLKEFGSLLAEIRQEKFDLVLDLQGLFRSGLVTGLSGAKRKVGFRNARELAWIFYSSRVELAIDKQNALRRYLDIIASLGVSVTKPKCGLNIPQQLKEWANKQWPVTETRIVICPGSRWQTKRWPAAKFVQLINELNASILLIGEDSERDVARQIVTGSKKSIINFVAKTDLQELTALLASSHLLVTNDSGPMHLAAALETPVVALFGPTDPVLTGPWGGQSMIIQAKIPCVPCLSRDCLYPKQAGRAEIGCMESIPVREVKSAVEELLSK